MRRIFLALAILAASIWALPADACEKCVKRYDGMVQQRCWVCDWVYCGFFSRRISGNTLYPSWPDDCENEDDCFTYEGVPYCGPDVQSDLRQQRSDQEWIVLGARVFAAPPTLVEKAPVG